VRGHEDRRRQVVGEAQGQAAPLPPGRTAPRHRKLGGSGTTHCPGNSTTTVENQ